MGPDEVIWYAIGALEKQGAKMQQSGPSQDHIEMYLAAKAASEKRDKVTNG